MKEISPALVGIQRVVAQTADEAVEAAKFTETTEPDGMTKAQIHAGGRGKGAE